MQNNSHHILNNRVVAEFFLRGKEVCLLVMMLLRGRERERKKGESGWSGCRMQDGGIKYLVMGYVPAARFDQPFDAPFDFGRCGDNLVLCFGKGKKN